MVPRRYWLNTSETGVDHCVKNAGNWQDNKRFQTI